MQHLLHTASRGLATLLIGLAFSAGALADEPGKDDAIKMVEKAVGMHQSSGKEKTLAAISQKDGLFHKGELYAFAYDTTGVIVAHPVNAKLIGKNMLEVPDPDGKLYRKAIVETAMAKGTGWVDYKYKNPKSGRVEPKTSYFRRVGDVIYLCGVYK